MTETPLTVAASPALLGTIATVVANLRRGFIDCGGGTRLKVQLPFRFFVVDMPHGLRITFDKDVLVDRPGINPWLEYLDLYESGRIVVRITKLGISVEQEVRP